MPLTGKEALELHEKLNRQEEERRAKLLAKEKAEAAARGKEPFDLGKLETMADTSDQGRLDPEEERFKRFEEMYYITFGNVMTLEEFARRVNELNKWSGG